MIKMFLGYLMKCNIIKISDSLLIIIYQYRFRKVSLFIAHIYNIS